MRRFLRSSDRLVAMQVLYALGLTWAVLVGFDAISALINELDEIQQGQYSLPLAMLYVAYTLPRRAYELFPTAALIGSVMGLGALAASSELTALRAAGIARWRIGASAGATVAALTLMMLVSAETIGPIGDLRAQALAMGAKSEDLAIAKRSGLWAREGDTFLNARRGALQGEGAVSRLVLEDVRLYEFNPDGALQAIAHAKRAEHVAGNWELYDVRRTTFAARSVSVQNVPHERWQSQLSPELLSFSVLRPRYLALSDIDENLDYLQRNELDTAAFESAWWSRVFYPVNALAMCLAVMPFAFGSLRSGGFGKRLFVGIAFGLGYYTVQRLSVSMAEVYHVPLWIAYGLPPLVFGLGSWGWFRRRF